MRILCVYGNPPPVTGSTIGALLTSVLKAMIFVRATCLAGLPNLHPGRRIWQSSGSGWPKRRPTPEVWNLLSADNPHLPQPAIGLTNHGIQMWQIRHLTL